MKNLSCKKYFKVKDVASYLGVSVATIYRLLTHDKSFPKGILLTPKCHLWNIDDINDWIENQSNSNNKFIGQTKENEENE